MLKDFIASSVSASEPNQNKTIIDLSFKLTDIFDFGADSNNGKAGSRAMGSLDNDRLRLFFAGTEVYRNTFAAIFKEYKNLSVLEQNPYQMIEKIRGVGFKKADTVAMKYKVPLNDINRLNAGIAFFITEQCNFGSTVIPKWRIENETHSSLGVTKGVLMERVAALIASGILIPTKNGLEINSLYAAEKYIAKTIMQLTNANNNAEDWRPQADSSPSSVSTGTSSVSTSLADDQLVAFNEVRESKFTCIFGAAGTGKTYLQKAIVDAWGGDVLLLAPTGIAARRQREATGKTASTIHSFIIKKMKDVDEAEEVNISNKKTLIIVDESGMITVPLFSALLRQLEGLDYTMILFGDDYQLPPIGPGSVLSDTIASSITSNVRSCKLNITKRQEEGNNILLLAQQVRSKIAITDNALTKEVTLLQADTMEGKIGLAVDAAKRLDIKETLILVARKRDRDAINERVKALLTKPITKERFSIGDKIIQNKNEIVGFGSAIVNGDIGFITRFDLLEYTIQFDAYYMPINVPTNAIHFELGYCLTCHKAQGCESDNVVLVLDESAKFFAGMRWLYTAITRAKKKLIIVGTRPELNTIAKFDAENRLTSLEEMIAKESLGDIKNA